MINPNMRFAKPYVQRYIRKNDVDGWLDEFSAYAIAALSVYQTEMDFRGAVAEIGVHHGKLFFVLYLTTRSDESAIALDVFDTQHLNLDQSGRGDKDIFIGHARRLREDLNGLKLIEDSSLNVSPATITSTGGPVRLFSIDGAHTEEVTLNDLRLVDASLTDEGIVILDDVFNEFWPEVSVGFARYLSSDNRDLAPFAITPGKVLLARPKYCALYNAFMRNAFPHRVDKTVQFYGHTIPIIGVTRWTLRRRLARTRLGSLAKGARDSQWPRTLLRRSGLMR